MARKNRLVVSDGVYHITTRVANRAFLFDDELKDRIVDWMYDVADFSGVNLLAWCVMENHLHLLVHVPEVPTRLWLTGDCPPNTSSFTLRPAECTPPRWTPSGACPPLSSVDDSSGACPPMSVGGGSFWDCPRPRPPVVFMLTDEEMMDRLAALYGDKIARTKVEGWVQLRADGRDAEVDAEKERYCRRMYNVSQFVKTLKERIAMRYNNGTYRQGAERRGYPHREPNHCGHLFEGRFHSVLVEKTRAGYGAVASYIAVNPVKAGIADMPNAWRWSSFALAVRGGSLRAERCRKAYERMFGCTWEEAKSLMEKLTSDRLPEGFDLKCGGFSYEADDGDGVLRRHPLRVTQAIWLKVAAFTRGTILSRDPSFAKGILSQLPPRFPHGGTWSVDFCSRLDWTHIA